MNKPREDIVQIRPYIDARATRDAQRYEELLALAIVRYVTTECESALTTIARRQAG